MEKLIIKNFGAIRDIAIDLKDLTIFIGETGTGKSTLAKLIAIFRSEDFWRGGANFLKYLSYYQIRDFLQDFTFIEYQSEMGVFVYNEGKWDAKFPEDILRKLGKFTNITDQEAQEDKVGMLLTKFIRSVCNEVIYIPAERSVVSFLSEKYAALDRKELISLFPDILLDFTARFNEVSSNIHKLLIDLFKVTYQKENGKDYIALSDDKQFLLSESASGLQTLVPTLLIFEYFAQDEEKKSYIFEEPELNLFPIAQKLLVELIAEKVLNKGHKMVITTHSPYVLTSINNLLFASQIQQKYPESKAKLMEVSGLKSFVSSSDIVVYYLSTRGENSDCSRSLIDKDTGLIPDNDLDSASDEIIEVFDNLMDVYRELRKSTH